MKFNFKGFETSLKSSWILNLRWIAVAGLFLTPAIASRIFNIGVNTRVIYSIAAFIALYNLALSIIFNEISINGREPSWLNSRILDNAQISLDLICLSILIHFSGGVENPFIFYFIFHVIISSIVLGRLDAFVQTTLAVFIFVLVGAGEYTGLMHHHGIPGYPASGLYKEPLYLAGVSAVFISTLYISFYMASSIARGIKDREEKLKAANALLQEKDRIKSEYVLRVSHDIKSHIAAIQSSIQPVMGGYAGELSEKQKNLLQRADARTEKLMQFVKSLLNLTILKLKDSDDVGIFKIAEICDAAVSMVSPAARAKNLEITKDYVPDSVEIKASKSEIQATIIEFLTNAVKYTCSGKVAIKTGVSGRSAFIEISDSGIGIPEKELPKIFNEFYRAQNAKEMDSMSSGLGLAMAKTVVEKYGGNISVSSQEGKSTKFTIILPLAGNQP